MTTGQGVRRRNRRARAQALQDDVLQAVTAANSAVVVGPPTDPTALMCSQQMTHTAIGELR